MSWEVSQETRQVHEPGTHPITETSRKEGAEPGPGPAVDPENENELQPVPLGDENQIILGPKGDQNSREIGYGEIVLRASLCSPPNPLQ
jgi:hypothetical protein